MQKFGLQVQTAFSQKEKSFPGFFIATEICMKFETLEKKHEYPSLLFSNVIDSERGGYLTSKRSCYRTLFGNQCINEFQTLLKSARHHYYPVFPINLGYIELEKVSISLI